MVTGSLRGVVLVSFGRGVLVEPEDPSGANVHCSLTGRRQRVVAAFIWVFGEAFGQLLTGGATDPDSGPLLALIALAYWPRATAGPEGKFP